MSTNLEKKESTILEPSKKKYPYKRSDEPPQKALENMVKQYIEDLTNYDRRRRFTTNELEVRFGTRGVKPLTKIDYDNVIVKLRSFGFSCENEQGQYMMRMTPEVLDPITGKVQPSHIRTELNGYNAIQDFCKNGNNLEEIHNNLIKYGGHSPVQFVRKSNVIVNDTRIFPVNFDDFNFRVSYQSETTMDIRHENISSILKGWVGLKKTFRYINRVTFVHPDFPVKVDMSILKTSSMSEKDKREFRYDYNTDDAHVFENPEVYEIELEVDNNKANLQNFKDADKLLESIRKVIKYVLMGLQETNYPCAYPEQYKIINEYVDMINKAVEKEERRDVKDNEKNRSREMNSRYPIFIGPSSCTLQIENILPISDNTTVPNIRTNYTVTDKADGDRNMMFISNSGKIYLINNNMKVIFSGAYTTNKEIINTLMDGEIIKHDKNGKFINLYAAFDIYFINGKDVRSYGFVPTKEGDNPSKFRLPILKNIIKVLRPKSIVPDELISPIRIQSKQFYPANPAVDNIFKACGYILGKEQENILEYNTDGIIFTPANMGVGTDKIGKLSPNNKNTWAYSFKWKPANFNTIDFLVTTKKGDAGTDLISPVFQDGLNTSETMQLSEYKTVILRCGFDENEDGFINPCQQLLEDKFPTMDTNLEGKKKRGDFKPVQFYPTSPSDLSAGICNIMLKKDDTGINQMYTEENEVFMDNTIVEFRYEMTNDQHWRWIPLRVRSDKTIQLRQGKPMFGNAYRVANSNWHSIHHPVTEEMISTGNNIPDEIDDEDVYYNTKPGERSKSRTDALRNFHNLYVKKLLISSVAKKGDTLIDYACGKAGDISKWISAHLSFVFGIDIKKDNLENRLDGACARFLKYHKMFKTMPYALFVNGNSGANIRSGLAMLNDKASAITRAVFGQSSKNISETLGPAVARQAGKGENGFQISSCQFALHYFFENHITFQNFMRNLAECTKLGGYFIGTAYDGKLIFNLLKNKNRGESEYLYDGDKKIWEIQKEYEGESILADDISSLGCQINVFQESINKMFPEYLINFDYLERVMVNYGFKLITRSEANSLGLPEGSGLFSELFNQMTTEIKNNKFKKNDYENAVNMNSIEKKISFLNRYFVYKKITNVNAEQISLELLEEESEKVKVTVPTPVIPKKIPVKQVKKLRLVVEPEKPRIRKLNRTLILQGDFEEEEEEEEQREEEKEEQRPIEQGIPVEVIGETQIPIEEKIMIKPKKTSRKLKPKITENV